MFLSTRLVILGVFFLVISCKFSEQPLYSFSGFNQSNGNHLNEIILSPDEDKIAINSMRCNKSVCNSWDYYQHQDFFNFYGGQICQQDNNLDNKSFIGWPSKTSGLYYNSQNNSLLKAKSPCDQPELLLKLDNDFSRTSTTFTSNDSFIAIHFYDRRIIEYNIGSGKISRQFILKDNEQVYEIQYTSNHKYLYVATKTSLSFKVIVFDANSGERKNQFNTELFFFKGLNDGETFLAYNQKTGIKYKVDKNGNKKAIQSSDQYYLAVCTNDDVLLTVRVSGTEGNTKHQLISYNNQNGQVQQTITLNFKPYHVKDCNDNYLALTDLLRTVYIYKYTHTNSNLHQDFNSDQHLNVLPHLQTQTKQKRNEHVNNLSMKKNPKIVYELNDLKELQFYKNNIYQSNFNNLEMRIVPF